MFLRKAIYDSSNEALGQTPDQEAAVLLPVRSDQHAVSASGVQPWRDGETAIHAVSARSGILDRQQAVDA